MKQVINDHWAIYKKGDSKVFDASLPESIINIYHEEGLIEDPYYRDNEKIAYEIARDDFIFEKTLSISNDQFNSDYVFLTFKGIDTLSTIYLNNKVIATTDNMHRTYKIDIKKQIKLGENHLKVVIDSPVKYIEEQWEKRGPIWGVNAKDGYQFLRKAHYMFGWDWGPAIADQGVFREVLLESYNNGYINDIYISQHHGDNYVDLTFESDYIANQNCQLKVSITDPNNIKIIEQIVTTKAIRIENPSIWWPREYGEQPLYNCVFTLEKENEIIDDKQYKIGLRTIGVKREKDQWGESFVYLVNNIEIFAKGANYIPEDLVLPRLSYERTKEVIKMAVKANFNSMRVWGGGIYPEDYFFDLCDEYGLLVWQDFMFACAQYKLDDETFIDTIKCEIKDNVRRLRHHASIVLWCGNNEMEQLWVDEQTEGRTKEQMDEYLVLFEDIIQKVAIAEDPDRLYWPASPSSGGKFDDPNAENRGDVHYWDVWHKEKPFTDYRKYFFRFCSEFGFQSFPCLKTVETFTDKEDRNIFSYIMESHQKNDGANSRILNYLSMNFKYPNNFENLLYVSQLLQAEAIKYGVEHWRRNRGRCMGSIYWQYNDCWPGPSWSSIDSYNRWKALHYFAKKFYSPVLLSVEENGFKAAIHVSNESKNDTSGTITYRLMTIKGEILDEGVVHARIKAHTDQMLIQLNYDNLLSDFNIAKNAYLVYEYESDHKDIYCSNSLLFVPQKYFEFKKATIDFTIKKANDIFTITLKSNTYAKYVEVYFNSFDVIVSDNFFDLYGNEEKTITIDMESVDKNICISDLKADIKIRSLVDTY